MDIERLKKLKQICFNKPTQNRKKQPQQASKSPANIKHSNFNSRIEEKENNSHSTINLKRSLERGRTSFEVGLKSKSQKRDLIQEKEQEFVSHYEQKQRQLEQNILMFQNNAKQKRISREQRMKQELTLKQYSDLEQLGGQDFNLFRQAQLHSRTLSPIRAEEFKEIQNYQDRKINQLDYQLAGQILSPSKRAKTHERQVKRGAQNIHVQRGLADPLIKFQGSQFSENLNELSFCDTSQFGFEERGFPQNQEVQKFKRVKQSLNNLLSILAQPNQKPLINMNSLNAIKQRLQGAFDKIQKISFQEQGSQLNQIIQGCLYDLSQKLVEASDSKSLSRQNQEVLQGFLYWTQGEVINLDLEQVAAKVIEYSAKVQVQRGLSQIENIQKSNADRLLRDGFSHLKRQYQIRQKQQLFIKILLERQSNRYHYQKLFRAFQTWREENRTSDQMVDKILNQNYRQHLLSEQSSLSSYKSFSDKLSKFISSSLKSLCFNNQHIFTDLIFVKPDSQFYFLKNDSTDSNLTALAQIPSSAFQFLQSNSAKLKIQENVLVSSNFNQETDLPFNCSHTLFLKDTNRLSQAWFPIFNSDKTQKKLKLLLRISIQNLGVQELEKAKANFKRVMGMMTAFIAQSYAIFKRQVKIEGQYSQLQSYNQQSNADSKISSLDLSCLQYLQRKTFEVSCCQSIAECFKLLQTLANELLAFQSLTYLVYDEGQIFKIYDASKPNLMHLGRTQDQKSSELIAQLINKKILNGAAQSNLSERMTLQILREEDKFEQERFKLTEYLVALLLKDSSCYSHLVQGDNSKIDSQVFIRLERKLQKEKDQIKLEQSIFSKAQIFSSFENFLHISLARMMNLEQSQNLIQLQADQTRFQENENEITRINQTNEELRKQLELQQDLNLFFEQVRNVDIVNNFEVLQVQLGELIRTKIPNGHKTQLFLTRQETSSNFLYTYVEDKHSKRRLQSRPLIDRSQIQTTATPKNLKLEIPTIQTGQLKTTLKQEIISQLPIQGQELTVRESLNDQHGDDELFSNTQYYPEREEANHPHNQQMRSRSQAQHNFQHFNGQVYNQLDDISSISGYDANTNNKDQNSFLINTFLNHEHQNAEAPQNQINGLHQRQQSLTRQPSINLLGTSSSTNLRVQLQAVQKQSRILRRDVSAQSELQKLSQLHFDTTNHNPSINIIKASDNQKQMNSAEQLPFKQNANGPIKPPLSSLNQNKRKQPALAETLLQEQRSPIRQRKGEDDFLITSQLIMDNTVLEGEEIQVQIVSQNPLYKLMEFKIGGSEENAKSILSFVAEIREPVVKRNLKNDKRFGAQMDNLINYQEDRRVVIENVIYVPLINQNSQELVGVLQVANNEKAATFTQQDQEVACYIGDKIAKYLVELKEEHSTKILFKKQLELSVLNSSLENQSVSRILHLANKLFSSKSKTSKTLNGNPEDPLQRVFKFISGCEHYLKKIFNCNGAQILFADHQGQHLFSLRSNSSQEKVGEGPIKFTERIQVFNRCGFGTESISTALVKGLIEDPVVWPSHSDYILIGDEGATDRSGLNSAFNPVFGQAAAQSFSAKEVFNCEVDAPIGFLDHVPQNYLAVCIRDRQQAQATAVIQLMQKQNGVRFIESDQSHLTLIASHMSQIFTHILNQDYFSFRRKQKEQVLLKVSVLMSKKLKKHYKAFFRELLAFKFGKVNLLKNKILRKYLNRHLKVDQILIDKVQKLATLRQRCESQNRQKAFEQLKEKIKCINERRQRNAQKCIQMISKYDRLLSIRVKDTVFKFWEQFKRQDLSQVSYCNQRRDESIDYDSYINDRSSAMSPTRKQKYLANMYSTFNAYPDQSSTLSNYQIQNQSSILDESSVTSALYLKAKACYKFRKLFNNQALRLWFDSFKIKAFSSVSDKKMSTLYFDESTVRLMKMRKIIRRSFLQSGKLLFKILYQNSKLLRLRDRIMRRLLKQKHSRGLALGLKSWQSQTENSMRSDLRQEKSYVSLLTEQCKEGTILQMMMLGINKAFKHSRFSSVEECLSSDAVKQLFTSLCENLLSQTLHSYSVVLSFKLPSNTQLSGQQYALFIYPAQDQEFTKAVLQQELSRISSVNDISRAQNVEQKLPNHFSSISEVLQTQGVGNMPTTPLAQFEVTGAQFNFNAINFQIQQGFPQPMFLIADMSEDSIFKSILSSKSPLGVNLSGNRDEYHLNSALSLRHLKDQASCLLIPMLSKISKKQNVLHSTKPIKPYQHSHSSSNQYEETYPNQSLTFNNTAVNPRSTQKATTQQRYELFGSLEIYQKAGSFDRNHQISTSGLNSEDGARFKQYQSVVQLGLEAFTQRLFYIQEEYNMQLEKEQLEIQKASELDIFKRSTTLSQIVRFLTDKVTRTFKADHCLMIFISPEGRQQSRGTFYNFENNKLYQVDFEDTFFQALLLGDTLHQITFPSSLVCKKALSTNTYSNCYESTAAGDLRAKGDGNRMQTISFRKPELFSTMTGEQNFEALKYIPIESTSSSNSLLVFLELGWHSLAQASQLHENDFYLQKKEALIKEKVVQHVQVVTQNIKFLVQSLRDKVTKVDYRKKTEQLFRRWREACALQRGGFLSTCKKTQLQSIQMLSPIEVRQRENMLQRQERNQQSKSVQSQEARRLHFHEDGGQSRSLSPLSKISGGRVSRDNSPNLSSLYFKSSNLQIVDPLSQPTSHTQSRSQPQPQRKHSPYLQSKLAQLKLTHGVDVLGQTAVQEDIYSELEVEKAAKRKLVSSSLLFVSLLSKSLRQWQLRQAFNSWEGFVSNALVAERAFNQILELNLKHSAVRFKTSVLMIERVMRREELRRVLTLLKQSDHQSNLYRRKAQMHFTHKQHQRVLSGEGQELIQLSDQRQLNTTNHNRHRSQDYQKDRRPPTSTQQSVPFSNGLSELRALPLDFNNAKDSSNLFRGIDTQAFEDEAFTIQELDQSMLNEFHNQNRQVLHDPPSIRQNEDQTQYQNRGVNQGLNMIIVSNEFSQNPSQKSMKRHQLSRSSSKQQSSSHQLSSHIQSNEVVLSNNQTNALMNNKAGSCFQMSQANNDFLSNPQFYTSHQSHNQHCQSSSGNDAESEFSLGQGTKNMIRIKADSILDQVRSEFRSKQSISSLQPFPNSQLESAQFNPHNSQDFHHLR